VREGEREKGKKKKRKIHLSQKMAAEKINPRLQQATKQPEEKCVYRTFFSSHKEITE